MSAASEPPAFTPAGVPVFATQALDAISNLRNVVVLLPARLKTPAVWPEMSTWPGRLCSARPQAPGDDVRTGGVDRQHARTRRGGPVFDPVRRVVAERVLAEVVERARPDEVRACTTRRHGGTGRHTGPCTLRCRSSRACRAIRPACAVELLTFCVTVTVFGCWRTFVETDIVVSSTGGPGSLPGTAASGV